MDFRVLEYMPDAVIVSGPDGGVLYVNATAEELFGYSRAELVGRPIEVLIPARFRSEHAAHRQAYYAAPRLRPMGIGLELSGLRKDGREFPVEISLAPLQAGPETYSIAAVRDVTERKRIEEHERQLRKAEEEIRRRDEVLTIASHELRAPVGSMQLQLGMLQRAATDTVDDLNAMRERMSRIERNARRLARLVDDLLDVSHIRFGELPLRFEETDLADLTREAIASLREEVERSGSQLTVRAEAPVLGRWDPVRIEQVIANLLLNAAKFGRGKPITVSVDGDPDRARVAVEDEGVGIAPEHHERIFERFERAIATGGAVGLGLGLYIARQIVQAHGGAILLRSSVGTGSTFTVDLPRAPPGPR